MPVRLAHALSVNDRCARSTARELVTFPLVSLNSSAPPIRPRAHLAPVTVPPVPFPDASETVVPRPSSKVQCATSPLRMPAAAGGVTGASAPTGARRPAAARRAGSASVPISSAESARS
ncbi:MAG: hypothetical protein ACYTKD_12345 [Planctomycetota bacterium]